MPSETKHNGSSNGTLKYGVGHRLAVFILL